jgi:hypothetical protein
MNHNTNKTDSHDITEILLKVPATQEIRFKITGVNQHSPSFTTTNLQVTIPENTLIGSSIASVSATDNDFSGPNGWKQQSLNC